MKADFRDIKNDIRRRIVEGAWALGDLVPNEVDLANEFGCARATVNRAMRELAEEGLIERKRKAGTRVRMAPKREARFDIPLVRNEIEARGEVYRYALVTREVTTTPEWLRARLNLAPDGQVMHLICMHYGGGNPYQYEDRWINLTALPRAVDEEFSDRGPNEWLIATVPFSDAEISFSAMSADENLADHMGCATGDALFMAERSTWWRGDAITYVRLFFQRGHRITTRY